MELKYFVVILLSISESFAAPSPLKSLSLKADKAILESLACGAHQNVKEGEQFYFRSKPSTRIPRSSPTAYWFPLPNHPQNRYPSVHSFSQNSFHNAFSLDPPHRSGFGQTYIKPRVCKWTFEANGNCQLVANFDHYESGDLNCNRQYLLLGDEDRDIQVCGYAPFPGHFKSNGNSLYIKHYRQPGAWNADFEGFVSCIKRRYQPEVVEYGPVSGEVSINDEGKLKELEAIVETELEESESGAEVLPVIEDNGIESATEISEVDQASTYLNPNDELIDDEKKEESQNTEVNGIEPRDEEIADEGYYAKSTTLSPHYAADALTEKPVYASNYDQNQNSEIPQYEASSPSYFESEGKKDKGTQTDFAPDGNYQEAQNNNDDYKPSTATVDYTNNESSYKPDESIQYEGNTPSYTPDEEKFDQYQSSTPAYVPAPEEPEKYQDQPPAPIYSPVTEEPEVYQPTTMAYNPAPEQYHPTTEIYNNAPEEPELPNEYQAEESAYSKNEPEKPEYTDSIHNKGEPDVPKA